MIEFITEYKQVVVAVHILGVALGLGGATITDFLFFRALKDRKVSDDELHLMHGLTMAIWAGVFLLVTSGIALFALRPDELLISAKFIAKMCAVAVAIVNGILLGTVITPRLQQFDFTFKKPESGGKVFHRLSFSLGAVSASSWYSAFILAFVPVDLDVPQWSLALLYGGILVAALLGGQVMYLLGSKISART